MSKSKIIIIVCIILAVVFLVVFMNKKDKPIVDLAVIGGDNLTSTTSVVNKNTTITPVKINNTATQKPSIKNPSVSDNSEFLVITYTKDGFSPKEVQIQKGRAVKFVNNSNSSLQVIFDDNKSQFYSEFSQSKSVGKGGNYIINFVYSGVWPFHNEFNKNHKVSVAVY